MKDALPLCCSPRAFSLMSRQLAALESTDGLLAGAVSIAAHQDTSADSSADVAAVDRTLQGFADTVRKRVRGSQPQALMAHLHEYLFEELKFTGNSEDYYEASNSYLPNVLKSRRGLPITLSLIYKIVGERVGLRVHGIGLPGHFLVAVEARDNPGEHALLIDPFSRGRILSIDEAREAVTETFGDAVEWTDELLQPVTNLHWLTRMLQNLLHVFGSRSDYRSVAAMLELEMLLWPGQTHLQRDLALVLARIGMSESASMWLNRYLKANPTDPQRGDLQQLLEVLST